MPRKKDLTNKTFGKLTVINEHSIRDKKGQVRWNCKCICGNMVTVTGVYLTNGDTRSCGCITIERIASLNKSHGLADKHPLYKTWLNMRNRCNNPTNPRYSSYGGRGIKICKEWDDFSVFVKDMGRRPGKNYSVDRIDNNKGYNKENCKWSTITEQNRNIRKNIKITHNGETKLLVDWCRILGIKYTTAYNRYKKGKNPFTKI